MVYVCTLEDDQVLIAFNRSEQTRKVDAGRFMCLAGLRPVERRIKHSGTIEIAEGKIKGLSLAPFSGLIASRS